MRRKKPVVDISSSSSSEEEQQQPSPGPSKRGNRPSKPGSKQLSINSIFAVAKPAATATIDLTAADDQGTERNQAHAASRRPSSSNPRKRRTLPSSSDDDDVELEQAQPKHAAGKDAGRRISASTGAGLELVTSSTGSNAMRSDKRTRPSTAQATASKSFQTSERAGALEANASPDDLWTQSCTPTAASDLIVHSKKVQELQDWLSQVRESKKAPKTGSQYLLNRAVLCCCTSTYDVSM